jgi:hypothetical protein
MNTRKKIAMLFAGAAVLFGVGGAIAAAQPIPAPPPQGARGRRRTERPRHAGSAGPAGTG